MKNRRGFSLIEVMLAMAISAIVVGMATYLIYGFFSQQRNLDVWSAGQIEMSMALRDVDGDIRNVVRLDPSENLDASGVENYYGLTSVSAADSPEPCLNDEASSVVRYTSLNRLKNSERLLRAWSEQTDAGKVGSANELRLTSIPGMGALFEKDRVPREIVLVDADRRSIRRYAVVGETLHENVDADPYDDLPKKDAAGTPILFTYRSVLLKMPGDVRGAPVAAKTAVFITGSEAYASNTFFLCLRKDDRSLIRVDQSTGNVDVLVKTPQPDYEMDSFRAGYLATKTGVRIEAAQFAPDMLVLPGKDCVNAVRFDLRLRPTEALRRKSEGELASAVGLISRTRTVYSENLSAKRPVSCSSL